MNKMEKLPKLVDVYQPKNRLESRQLPLMVDENLTLVMDIKNSNLICDNQNLSQKEYNEFSAKMGLLSQEEIEDSLVITRNELMEVLNQSVPCVGCRRSVERLYLQLLRLNHPTLDPIVVRTDGTITLRKEKHTYNCLASIFHDHAQRLEILIETQPKRNKKSVRCLLHSLDSQRSRPLTPVWRDIWDCMKIDCRKDVCIIEASSLHETLENYLRKHRFCGECRTKVLKAYTLLVEDPEPTKEKGYVSSLYSGIKRCLQDKHIHLNPKTEYITKLINRAEPELLGRERHAKTLEIAQEEVLTCLGICMYERLHRVYMKVREEERTCQLFAAVAVHTLNRSFETVIEKVRGISQLELLYEEFAREEQAKQKHKEAKKIRRKRRKGKMSEGDEKEENCCGIGEKGCSCSPVSIGGGGKEVTTCEEEEEECDCSSEELDDYEDCSNKLIGHAKGKLRCSNEVWMDECKCDNTSVKDLNRNRKEPSLCKCDIPVDLNSKKESGSSSDHSAHDCGYSSENNNGCCETGSLASLSLSSSPEGSELACSDTCCQPTTLDFGSQCRLTCGGGGGLTLLEMLEVHSEEDEECYITAEEVREFKSRSRQVYEKRLELRETLQKRFAQFCHNGPSLLAQTKYASN
ncbi:gametogenetin-binding protein 2-like isoform X2 [Anthonomus grandis grandis]|uniref:gametogenetin-binding protein 2-like isoform X2 n=1 Tax=Anthonomus grandis grandis TaxID=2921223 RepID=UPI00216699F1|nr:gametogenetin-binding protein 2-like isoform X2 [Anthonomus grandis grandis]